MSGRSAEKDARLTDAACHDCCARWTESGGREHDATCAENDVPVQYGVQILVNADSPSAHWKFDEDYPLHDNAEDAQADLAEALDYGYADEHTRVVAVSVLPPEGSQT